MRKKKMAAGRFGLALAGLLVVLAAAVPAGSDAVYAAPVVIANGSDEGTDTGAVASPDDYIPTDSVGSEDMVPVTAAEITDGTYAITVDSSSSMFRIVACELTVSDGMMTADMTLSGTGYLYLYPGTGEEAAAAPEDELIGYTENAEGQYVYTFPVEALDQEVQCAAFSKRKQQWYNRTLVFLTDEMPEGAITANGSEADAASDPAQDVAAEDTSSALWKVWLPVILVAVIVVWQILRRRGKQQA